MRYVFNAVYLVLVLITFPYWLFQAIRTGKYRVGLVKRFLGIASPPRSSKPIVWFHAVSVGEVILLRSLLERFRDQRPDLELALSTTTATGYALAKEKYPYLQVFRSPLDFTWAVGRVFQTLNPALLVLVELELWPNLLLEARRRCVSVAVVNARLSERSFRGYRRITWLLGPALAAVRWWGPQNQTFADRIAQLLPRSTSVPLAPPLDCGAGVPPAFTLSAGETPAPQRSTFHSTSTDSFAAGAPTIVVTGSMKYDGAATDRGNPKTLALGRLLGFADDRATNALRDTTDRPIIFLAGSTQAPEEEILLDLFESLRQARPALRLILVPRHSERFDAVADLLSRRGIEFVRRSRIEQPLDQPAPVTLVDTIGELAALWGLADFGYVGGSLENQRGGQSMIEPAALGVPVCFGPNTWNFQETVDRLLEHRAAVQITTRLQLRQTIEQWLNDPGQAAVLGAAARQFIAAHQGATEITYSHLTQLLPPLAANDSAAA